MPETSAIWPVADGSTIVLVDCSGDADERLWSIRSQLSKHGIECWRWASTEHRRGVRARMPGRRRSDAGMLRRATKASNARLRMLTHVGQGTIGGPLLRFARDLGDNLTVVILVRPVLPTLQACWRRALLRGDGTPFDEWAAPRLSEADAVDPMGLLSELNAACRSVVAIVGEDDEADRGLSAALGVPVDLVSTVDTPPMTAETQAFLLALNRRMSRGYDENPTWLIEALTSMVDDVPASGPTVVASGQTTDLANAVEHRWAASLLASSVQIDGDPRILLDEGRTRSVNTTSVETVDIEIASRIALAAFHHGLDARSDSDLSSWETEIISAEIERRRANGEMAEDER